MNASGKTLPALLLFAALLADGFLAGGLLAGHTAAPGTGFDGLGNVLGGITIGVVVAIVLGIALVRRLERGALLRCAAGASLLLFVLIGIVVVSQRTDESQLP